jgi:uncharacterized protein YecT (DUF1311 family)
MMQSFRRMVGALLCAAGFIGLGLAASGVAHAEAAAADPIDSAMQRCLARADMSSTAGQVQCIDTANKAWQGAIDAAYQQLLANAPDKPRVGWQRGWQRDWQESQRRWLAWRNVEMQLMRAVYETTQGTMYAMSEANMLLQPVRDRALELRAAARRFSAAQQAGDAKASVLRVRPCSADAACEHANYDLNRYYRKLHAKLPAHSRPALVRAQRAWLAFRGATTPLASEQDRVDLIGARVATMKRLSETVGSD